MTAFLRDDLWSAPYVKAAEHVAGTSERDSLVAPKARWHFVESTCVATAQAVVYIVPTTFMLVAHVFATVVNQVVENKLSRQTSSLFYECNGKLWGALATIPIALLSATTSVRISHNARLWLSGVAANDWAAFRDTQLQKLFDRVDDVREERLKSCSGDELYNMGTSVWRTDRRQQAHKSWLLYDALAEQMKNKVRLYVREVDTLMASPTASEEEKFKRFQEVSEKISVYIDKKCNRLGRLPMTYDEVGAYELAKAEKLKNKAVSYLYDQAGTVGRLKQREFPTKFDAKAYNGRIGEYAKGVIGDFDSRIGKLQRRSDAMKQAWKDKVVPLKGQESALISKLQSYARWMRWLGGLIGEETAARYQEEISEIQMQLQYVRRQKAQQIAQIKKREFRSMQGEKLSYHKLFNSYMDPCNTPGVNLWRMSPNRSILRQIYKIAEPSWVSWGWRGAGKPLVGWLPLVGRELEDWFDPDTQGRNGWFANWITG